MTYQHLTTKEIEKWFNVKSEYIPRNVILHGTWPWEDTVENYANKFLKNPKKLSNLGNFVVGTHNGIKIGYAIIYGPGMAADISYILMKLGVKNIFLVGGIGALQTKIKMGDLIIPQESITLQDGTSQFYSKDAVVSCDKRLLKILKEVLKEKNIKDYHVGKTLSISTLFAESKKWVDKWNKEGVLGSDMETSAVYTISKMLGSRSLALLQVIDSLVLKDKTIDKLDANKEANKMRQERGRLMLDIVFEMIKMVK